MKLIVYAEDDNSDKEYSMEFKTGDFDSNEIVQCNIDSYEEDFDKEATEISFTISVSDLAAVVTALEKMRDDGWKRERDLK